MAAYQKPSTGHKRSLSVVAIRLPTASIRYVFYAFVFSIPFEALDIGLTGTLSRLIGFVLLLLTVFHEKGFLFRPPQAFWYFLTYLLLYAIIGVLVSIPESREFAPEIITQMKTQIQLLILFLIAYNLMRSDRVKKGALLALSLSCVSLAVLQILGVTRSDFSQERISAFGENPNTLASVLSLGLLALIGLAYGRKEMDRKLRWIASLSFLVLLLSIVRTGSRGDVLALALSLFTLAVKPEGLSRSLKTALIVITVVSSLAIVSYQLSPVRERWERTYYEGDVAGREDIFTAAWGMFLEKPVFGWGPVNHIYELGLRVGEPRRDPHSLYLWLLIEVGIVGLLPFFAGLWLCWSSAWKGRGSVQGTLPLAMLVFFLVVNFKGTWLLAKLFWLVLSYALAAGGYAWIPSQTYLKASRVPIYRKIHHPA